MRLDRGQIEVVDDEMAQVLRSKTGAERIQIANGMFLSARQMMLSMLRAEHSDWTEQQGNEEAARRLCQ